MGSVQEDLALQLSEVIQKIQTVSSELKQQQQQQASRPPQLSVEEKYKKICEKMKQLTLEL